MKHFYTFLLLLFGLTASYQSVAQGSLAALDAKNGFKEFILGSSISNYKNLAYSNTSVFSTYTQEYTYEFDGYLDAYLKMYDVKGNKLKIADLELDTPTCFFFDGILTRVDFQMSNWEGKQLIKLYTNLYGKYNVVNEKNKLGSYVCTYHWRGNKVSLSVSYCKNPYKVSNSSDSKENLPPYLIRYASIPMLMKIALAENKAKNTINKKRASDL